MPQPQNCHLTIRVVLMDLLEGSQIPLAGGAPAGPKLKHHDPAPKVREMDSRPIRIGELKVGRQPELQGSGSGSLRRLYPGSYLHAHGLSPKHTAQQQNPCPKRPFHGRMTFSVVR